MAHTPPLESQKIKDSEDQQGKSSSNFDVMHLLMEGRNNKLFNGSSTDQNSNQPSSLLDHDSLHIPDLWGNTNTASKGSSSDSNQNRNNRTNDKDGDHDHRRHHHHKDDHHTGSGSSSGNADTPPSSSGNGDTPPSSTGNGDTPPSSSGSGDTPVSPSQPGSGAPAGSDGSGTPTTPGDGTTGSNTSGLQNILTIPADTAPQLTNNTYGSGALKSASISTNNGTVTMTEAGANADEMWYSHYKDNGGNTISDNIQVNLPSNMSGVHAVEMGAVVVRNGYKDELELQFKPNGNGTDEMSYFSNAPSLGAHGGWVAAGTVSALHGGENSVDFSGQILNNGSNLQFDNISVNGQSVATPAEFQAGSASGWGLAGQVDQHMQIDNNSSTAPVTSEWTVSSSQTSGAPATGGDGGSTSPGGSSEPSSGGASTGAGDGSGTGGASSGSAGGDSGTSSGAGSGDIPPPGATAITGLDNASNERPDTSASDIGGSGDVQSISASQAGPNAVNFSMTGGKWGDGLWLTSVKTPLTEQNKNFNLQLNDTFSLTPSDLQNDHEIEKDIVGPWGVAGTQINPQTGEVDYWNAAASKWTDVGSLGPLQANKDYNLQLDVSTNGNPDSGTYSFDNYSLNGQQLNATQTTFNDKDLGWAPGLYVQTQLDLPDSPDGTVAGMSETGQTLYVS